MIPPRKPKVGTNLGQRGKDKKPLSDPWMRENQLWNKQGHFVAVQEIQIKGAGLIDSMNSRASCREFKSLQSLK